MRNISDELARKLQSSTVSVAILTPIGRGSHGQVAQGLTERAEKGDNVFRVYPFYSRSLSENHIRLCLWEILAEKYDAIVTVGFNCTSIAHQVLSEKGWPIPLIFVGVNPPYTYEFYDIENKRGIGRTAGVVYTDHETINGLHFLRECAPHLNSWLIPVEKVKESSSREPSALSAWPQPEVARAQWFGKKHGIKAKALRYPTTLEMRQGVEEALPNYDAILQLEGTSSFYLHRAFTNLCNKSGKTLFAGLTEGVAFGAAIGYGADFAELGYQAAEYIREILFNDVEPSTLPLHRVDSLRTAAVNLATAERQGCNPELLKTACERWSGTIFETAQCDEAPGEE